MSYYANGNGFIAFKKALTEEEFSRAEDILSDGLESDGIRKAKRRYADGSQPDESYTYFDIWSSEKYCGELVEDALNGVAEIAEIDSGEINFVGEDQELWRFIFSDGKWVEQNGTVVYIQDSRSELFNRIVTESGINEEQVGKIRAILNESGFCC